MKQRFSSVDVKVIASELNRSLVSLRISNIYDLSSRIFLFKCAKPGYKEQFLVDSGFRCHLTSFTRTAASAPSAFVQRLRKYLKSRRITSVSQVGTDRVIEIGFSDGQYRLYLEFFAGGNIVLTDKELNVLALLRQVSEGDEDVDVKLGGKYVLDAKQNFHGIPELSQERLKEALEKQIAKFKAANEVGGKKAKRNKGGDDLRKAVSIGFPEYPPHLLDHVFRETGFDPLVKPQDVVQSDALMEKLMVAIRKAEAIFKSLDDTTISKGYIIAKTKEAGTSNDTKEADGSQPKRDSLLYDDFHPFRPSQFVGKQDIHILELEGYNKTVDEFYSSLESQKLESRLTEREAAAKKKLDTAKSEHEKRLGALQHVQELHIRKAQTIEANGHRVEEAIAAVNGLIGQGMDWQDIGKLIENEQGRSNVVAQMIKLPLKLYENTVTLLLDEPGVDDESEDEEEDITDSEADDSEDEGTARKPKPAQADKRLAIDIDLGQSPWANARQYYEQKKTAAQKEQKTLAASQMALKSTEKKIEADLKKGLKQEKDALRPSRRQLWFEKFLYFISSDGYLVIGGKDAQQNELLYRRYLKKGDIYVNADLQGASSIIVKNNPTTPDAPIPPSTLSQAGALTICTSSAWDSKAVMAAWWVNSDQVSKTAPTGEYLATGGFVIKGKKNFLPPSQLLLGFGVYWLISEESRSNHGKHRLIRTENKLDGESEVLTEEVGSLTIDNSEEPQNTSHNNDDSVIPDVEDAADEAEKEIEDDEEAGDASDDDDKASTVASEIGSRRNNPLQSHHRSNTDDITNENDSTDNDSDTVHPAKLEIEVADDLEDNQDSEDGSDDGAPADTPEGSQTPSSAAQQNTTTKAKQAQPKRGKNTKARKAALKKYALQDEEDRELAMQLLGSAKGQEKKQAEAESKAARDARLQADKERRRLQHEKAAKAEEARQQRLARAEHNGEAVEDIDEQSAEQVELERKEHMNIDLLVPVPEPGDTLLAAIPVVAPWGALGRCKYKVKIQPGSVKKGKAVREIVNTWTTLGAKGPKVVDDTNKDKERVWARELECFKAWRVEEVISLLPVKGCRIVQSGGTAGASGAGAGSYKNKGGSGGRGGKGSKKSR